MPLISPITRRHPRTRIIYGVILSSLILGALTMIYPFLLMISGSGKSAVDRKSMSIIPEFLISDAALYRKYTESLFNESVDAMNIAYDQSLASFEKVTLPSVGAQKLTEDLIDFIRTQPLPDFAVACGALRTPVSKTTPRNLRRFQSEMSTRFGGNIDALNDTFQTQFSGWNAFFVIPVSYLDRTAILSDQPLAKELAAFQKRTIDGWRYLHSVDGFYKRIYLKSIYTSGIEAYNAKHHTHFASFDDIILPDRLPAGNTATAEDWVGFVRHVLNPLWLQLDEGAAQKYADFLRARYQDVDHLNRIYTTTYQSLQSIGIPDPVTLRGVALSDWILFLVGWTDPNTQQLYQAPIDAFRIVSTDECFRNYLTKQYGSIEQFNREHATTYQSYSQVTIPQESWHYQYFTHNTGSLRWEFATRNYLAVLDYLLLHGRGISNTLIYCGLSVLFALLVNPLAAYALSRYRLKRTYQILLLLMLTMAFPPMVTQIPVFLTMRDLDMLNTFWALILPGLANGYSIFLLKGFFDSLPKELYESASIDGASEWVMFWHITMSLSKPVLAVIGLSAFTLAYSNFMFALLICQDEKMWTMMVWLYQLQQRCGEGVMYACLVVAAIPTFVIFVFCQNIIMRGIVIPTEK